MANARRARRATQPIAVLAAAALSLAACGGGGGTTFTPPADGCDGSGLTTAPGVRCFNPSQFSGNTLAVQVPTLGATERVAVLVVNAGGSDNKTGNPTTSVAVSGTGAAPALIASPAPALAPALVAGGAAAASLADRHRGMQEAHEALRRWDRARLAALPPEPLTAAPAPVSAAAAMTPADVGTATRSFCHAQYSLNVNTGATIISMVPASATLRAVSPGGKAQFWVTDAAWNGAPASGTTPAIPSLTATLADGGSTPAAFFQAVGSAYDGAITTALNTYFGAQSDYDGNGQMMFVFADLGSVGDAFVAGYFTAGDLRPLDASADCSGSASNAADVLFLTDPTTFVSKNFPVADLRDVEYPGTMAHELQHDVNWNERCRLTRLPICNTFQSDDDWVNEGLSMVSEDAAGYGLATSLTDSEFVRVGKYLREYRDYSLTRWESDPVGNYGGVHAFMRYWLDQEGPTFTRRVVTSGKTGTLGVAAVLGRPFSAAMLRFTNAAVFSGETFSPLPALDYAAGAAWSPLHQKLKWDRPLPAGGTVRDDAYVDYTPLPVPVGTPFPHLRQDGWGAFLTGTGSGAAATVTVTSTALLKPHVLVITFTGTLPR